MRQLNAHGENGLALVPHENLPGNPPFATVLGDETATDMKKRFEGYLLQLSRDQTEQFFSQESDPEHDVYVDYTGYVPPEVKLAVLRKTAPSCYASDWHNLENDYMTAGQVARAQKDPDKYVRSKAVQRYYPAKFWETSMPGENCLLDAQKAYLEEI